VGAGACVLGAIVIGSSSRIAAGAVVVKSVPPDSVVVGVPGHVTFVGGKRIVPEAATPQVDMPDPAAEAIASLGKRVEALEAQLDETTGRHGTPTP